MRKELSPHIASLIEQFVPEHIRSNYPQFIEFVEAYLDYLEYSNKSSYYQNTLSQQRDIRTQEDQFLGLIQKEIGLFVPEEYASNPKVFYDHISDLWRSKGTTEAVKTFFRLFLNDAVEIQYPWGQVLKPSDGRWIVEDKLRVTMLSGEAENFAGKEVQQLGSNGRARVDSVERKVYSDGIIYELTLVLGTQVGKFEPKEKIIGPDGTKAEIYRSLSDINIIKGGKNYRRGDRIRVEGFEGFTFTAYVSGVDGVSGAITQARISNYGAGNTPDHVMKSDNPPEYYFRDFLLYRYSDNTQIGPSKSINNLKTFLQDTAINIPFIDREIIVQGRIEPIIIPLTELNLTVPTRSTTDIEIPISTTFLNPVFEIDTEEGEGAEFLLAYSGVVTTPGYYQDVRGQLSESIVLQDSYYYQKYSYQVSTNYSTRKWIDALKQTVHPAGTEIFGNVRINEFLNTKAKGALIYTAKADPSSYITKETPRLSNNPLGFAQDYTIPEQVFFSEAYVGVEFFNDEYVDTTESSMQSFNVEEEEDFVEL